MFIGGPIVNTYLQSHASHADDHEDWLHIMQAAFPVHACHTGERFLLRMTLMSF